MSSRAFNRDSTTDDVLEGIDLVGKNAIVTGASGGLGAETARALAAKGCKVTIAARDVAKAQAVIDEITAQHPEAHIDIGELELSVPDSVRAFASHWQEAHGQLDLLILNAGVMACPLSRTQEGWEMQLATNHFGHFLLTQALLPALQTAGANGGARVVALSSAGHRLSPVLLDDPHFERSEYNPWVAYGQSKSANALFALEADRRLQARGIRVFSVHPGVIYTDLSRYLDEKTLADMMDRMQLEDGFETKSVAAGAATSVWAATAPELADKGGIYLADCNIVPPAAESKDGYAPHIADADAAGALWRLTEEALAVTFD